MLKKIVLIAAVFLMTASLVFGAEKVYYEGSITEIGDGTVTITDSGRAPSGVVVNVSDGDDIRHEKSIEMSETKGKKVMAKGKKGDDGVFNVQDVVWVDPPMDQTGVKGWAIFGTVKEIGDDTMTFDVDGETVTANISGSTKATHRKILDADELAKGDEVSFWGSKDGDTITVSTMNITHKAEESEDSE
ncbi:MAG: hypothetical protein ACLFUS_10065 [Candidatus Sumerlaeia bacterium]